MAKKTKKNDKLATVEEKPTALVAPEDLFEDENTGFEETDNDCFSIPYLQCLQKLSPQCDADKPGYMEDAAPGMFLNSATGELYDGEEGVLLIPCHAQRRFVEWVPREQGGGYRGDRSPDSVDLSLLERDEKGRFLLDSGNHLMDTRYHYCLLVTETSIDPVVLSLTSTQIKKSKNWMTAMRNKKALNPRTGKLQGVPMMANVWRLTSETQMKGEDTWKGYKFTFDRMLDFGNELELDLYQTAKAFHEQVTSGQAQVTEKSGDNGDDLADENNPF